MGTTPNKGIRYPEPTNWAEEVYVRTQHVAEDTNAAFVTMDGRLDGLDAKTTVTQGTTNNLKGVALTRYGNCAGVYTHLPNDGVVRTVSQHTDQFYIPANASHAIVSIMNTGYSSANAAGAWYPLVSFNTGGTNWQNLGEHVVHNQSQPALDLGCSVVMDFNVRENRGNYGSVALQGYCAAASGTWITVGYMRWSVTLLG